MFAYTILSLISLVSDQTPYTVGCWEQRSQKSCWTQGAFPCYREPEESGCQFVQIGKSARGPVLQEAERRDAAASEWKLSRSAQTVQTLSIQSWGGDTIQQDAGWDPTNAGTWLMKGATKQCITCPPRMAMRRCDRCAHLHLVTTYYSQSVFSSLYYF